MATTPIYNWSIPDNTDLVKNGALAIRTLGDAIDTTMATMTPKTIVDAKGDLVTATADNTPARLAVGNNGETLVADSLTSTGLRYQAPVQANPVINSAMQIAQRGTSISVGAGAAYTLDRWQGFRSGAAAGETVSRQVTGDTTNLAFIQYCARVQRDSGNTSTAYLSYSQSFESVNSIPFAGKTVTLSYYARKGANFSATSSALVNAIYVGSGTDQNWISGYTGFGVAVQETKTLTTTWQRFSSTVTLPSATTELAINILYDPTGTAGAADYFEVTGVQLEVGSVATPFHTLGGTIQGELAACQRYYFRAGGQNAYQVFGQGIGSSSTQAVIQIALPVQMRVAPGGIDFSSLSVRDTASFTAVTGVTDAGSSANLALINAAVASGLTQYRPYFLQVNNNINAFIGFSAEL
jgi:hypothetical protein